MRHILNPISLPVIFVLVDLCHTRKKVQITLITMKFYVDYCSTFKKQGFNTLIKAFFLATLCLAPKPLSSSTSPGKCCGPLLEENLSFVYDPGITKKENPSHSTTRGIEAEKHTVNQENAWGELFLLRVINGRGSGNYKAGEEIDVIADDAPSRMHRNATEVVFDKWIGDVEYLEDIWSPQTVLTMPARAATVEATYKVVTKEAFRTHTIPGKIESEHYDMGGMGLSYRDDDTREGGFLYRTQDMVDLVDKSDASNGVSVGYSQSGEWLDYTISGVKHGLYDIKFRYASGSRFKLGDLKISLDGHELATFTDLEPTAGWYDFTTVVIRDVRVSGGNNKVLRLEYVNGGGFDLDVIEFVDKNSPSCLPSTSVFTAQHGVYKQNRKVRDTNVLRIEENRRTSYLQFDVSNICGVITEATLWLKNEGSEWGSGSFKVYKAGHSQWSNATRDAKKLPGRSGRLLDEYEDYSITAGEELTFDVTRAVTRNGTISFIIEHKNGNDIKVYSDNVSNELYHPRLIVKYGSKTNSKSKVTGNNTNTTLEPGAAEYTTQVLVYPNPSQDGKLTIAGINEAGTIKSANLISMQGLTIPVIPVKENDGEYSIDVPGIDRGLYMLQLQFLDHTVTKRVHIE